MQKIIFFFIAIGISLGSITAQTYSGKKTVSGTEQAYFPDTLKILAVLADFPEDKDATTFGNGKFGSIYSKDYGNKIIDPLPHDHSYFENHLKFAENYFRKVSSGKTIISYNILPGIVTVSKTMRNYSPPNDNSDLDALGVFAKEVWQKADSSNPGVNFSQYDLFTIFHAGAGRDISLPGSFGNEKDLPSVYLSDKVLRSIFNDNIAGLPLNRELKVNSMIIPETESRELDVIGGIALLEISINGLIAANIASHLGLPDLFDTNTGLSAIGRLGLMDGQAIFAYNGLFPPEPSPWEKMYLGWINPVEVRSGGQFQLIAKGLTQNGDTPVIKIPLNSSEYYLVELRHRDAKNDGAVITFISDSQVQTRVFPKDTTGFYSYDVDSVSGVVIDVDDFDWALPGSGILIWHIDETIINQNIADNKINVDKFRRGVDVEEADGIQDIGEKFFTIFGDEVVGEGAQEDFWYRGNKSKLYKNRFDKNSLPSTMSNTGANSLITLSDISPINTTMSFTLTFGDSLVSPLPPRNILWTPEKFELTVSDSNRFYILADSALLYDEFLQYFLRRINDFSRFKPAVVSKGIEDIVVGAFGNQLNAIKNNGVEISSKSLQLDHIITAPPVISDNSDEIIVGLSNGDINYYSIEGFFSDPQLLRTEKTGSNLPIKQLAVSGNYVAALKYFGQGDSIVTFPMEYEVADNSNNLILRRTEVIPEKFILLKTGGSYTVIVLEKNNIFNVIRNTGSERFEVKSENDISSFAVADLKQDGQISIIFTNGNRLHAVNLLGVEVPGFPYADTSNAEFTGTPLILDYNGDKNLEILTYTDEGKIFLLGTDGKNINGFPITAGESLSTVPVLIRTQNNITLTGLSYKNIHFWNLNTDNSILYWSDEYGNNRNQSSALAAPVTNPVTEFFPGERAYNWPNPVYEDYTNIRYYVSEDSHMNIKIFDLAGDFVAELNHEAKGGFDNEVRWDVSNIQSGVYLARIEASGASGKNENTIIKIAVIK